MGTRVTLALGLALAMVLEAELGSLRADSSQPAAENPDGGAPLVVVPNSSAPAPAESGGETAGQPPPRALDSKRTPMPDRLANDHWLQYFPMAPPTPTIPDNSGTTKKSGGGANRTSQIFKGASGGAPPDLPRDSVTRTPEDQLAPPTYPTQGPR